MKFQRINEKQKTSIFSCSKNDLPATQTANISKVNRNTVNGYFNLIRRMISSESIREAKAKIGECEWRHNHHHDDLYKLIGKLCNNIVLNNRNKGE